MRKAIHRLILSIRQNLPYKNFANKISNSASIYTLSCISPIDLSSQKPCPPNPQPQHQQSSKPPGSAKTVRHLPLGGPPPTSSMPTPHAKLPISPSSGKQWHTRKTPFRRNTTQKSYAQRCVERKAQAAMKAKEREMKDEKEGERMVWRFLSLC